MSGWEVESCLLERQGDLLVLDKPAGWCTTGRSLADEDSLQFHLMRHFGGMVWAAHQLDADTSGLCLFALNKGLVARLQALWGNAGMVKEYLAIVHGEPVWEQHETRAPIGEVSPGCLGVHPGGKPAHSTFAVLDRAGGFSLVRARIHTGRTHQIRIHLSHLGHPLVGEEWYRQPPCVLHPRQALHAWRLHFPPGNALGLGSFAAPVPADLRGLAARLGLRLPVSAPSAR